MIDQIDGMTTLLSSRAVSVASAFVSRGQNTHILSTCLPYQDNFICHHNSPIKFLIELVATYKRLVGGSLLLTFYIVILLTATTGDLVLAMVQFRWSTCTTISFSSGWR